MNNLRQIANNTIPVSKEKYFHSQKVFNTDDIIEAVRNAHDLALPQTKKLAAAIPGQTVAAYCRNLYKLLFDNVQYRPDIIGTQYVQLPSEVWNSKVCDCKSYSLFIATTLQNKGIPFKYRFVSYQPGSKKVTHVYIVVPNGSTYIIMDVVYKKFNREKKPFYYKKEMKKNSIGLHIVGSIGNAYGLSRSEIGKITNKILSDQKKKQPFNFGNRDITEMSEGEMDLWIARDRTQLLKEAVEGITGIGSLKAEQFNDRLDVLDDALESVQAADDGKIDDDQLEYELVTIANDAVNGLYSIAPEIAGAEIGRGFFKRLKKKVKKAAKKVKSRVKKVVKKRKAVIKKVKKKVSKTKVGKFVVKAVEKRNKALKKVAKGVVKVLTYPQRKIMEAIFKKKLPKSAPHFIYLYIPKSEVKKFPKKVQDKRAKSERIKKFIQKATGMKDKQFMGIVRNGIIKKYKKEPEKVIDEMAKGNKVSFVAGIHVDGYQGTMELIAEIGKLNFALHGRRGRKPHISPDDSPHANDLKNVRRVRVRHVAARKGKAGIKRKRFELFKGKNIKRNVKPMYNSKQRRRINKVRPKIRKAAPNFMYLFFPKRSFKKLPQNIRHKRKNQELLANRITNDLQMSKADFMHETRRGIKQRYGREPEAVLKGFINGTINGDEIGIIESILDLLNSIVGLFNKKKKSPKVSKNDIPDTSDFGYLVDDINDTKKQIKDLKNSDLPAKEKRELKKELKQELKAKEKELKQAKKQGYTAAKESTPETSDFKNLAKDVATDLTNDVLNVPNSEKPGLYNSVKQVYNKSKNVYDTVNPVKKSTTNPNYDINMDVPDDEPQDYNRGGSNFWSSLG